MNIQTILIPVDLSNCSFKLAEEAASLALVHKAKLVFLHVMELPDGLRTDIQIQTEGGSFRSLGHYMEEGAALSMPKYHELAEKVGVSSVHQMRFGHVRDAILEVAEEEGVDLIIMGTHGRQGLTRMMLGSVAEGVMRNAKVPVMTFKLHEPDCDVYSNDEFSKAREQAIAELEG